MTSNLIFKGYKVKDISFKLMNIEPGITNFKLNPKIGVNVHKFDKGFDMVMNLDILKENDLPVPFELSLCLISKFLVANIDEVNLNVLVAKAAEIVFPYLRSVVSSITMSANITPYVLPIINMSNIFANNPTITNRSPKKEGGSEITKVLI